MFWISAQGDAAGTDDTQKVMENTHVNETQIAAESQVRSSFTFAFHC